MACVAHGSRPELARILKAAGALACRSPGLCPANYRQVGTPLHAAGGPLRCRNNGKPPEAHAGRERPGAGQPLPFPSSRGKPAAAAGAHVRPCLQISGQRLANYRQVRKPMQAGKLRSWSALPGNQLKWIHMRPGRQRHGASHDRAGRKGKPRKEAPRPSNGPPPLFCTLCALPADLRQNPPPWRMFPPFRDFRAELEAFTLAIGKNPPASPRTCGGLPLALPCAAANVPALVLFLQKSN